MVQGHSTKNNFHPNNKQINRELLFVTIFTKAKSCRDSAQIDLNFDKNLFEV